MGYCTSLSTSKPLVTFLRFKPNQDPSAGQVGPVSRFLNRKDAPEHADPETLGMAMFSEQTSEQWAKLYEINVFSMYFVTTAFLGLLAKGSTQYSSVVINITSVSGSMKLAQEHVSLQNPQLPRNNAEKVRSSRTIVAKRQRRI